MAENDSKTTEEKDKEAPEKQFTHYLHLVDGTVKRYEREHPDDVLPTHFNGVRVHSVYGV